MSRKMITYGFFPADYFLLFPLFSENNSLEIQNNSRSRGKSCSQWCFVTWGNGNFQIFYVDPEQRKNSSDDIHKRAGVKIGSARQDGGRRIYPQTFCKVFETQGITWNSMLGIFKFIHIMG